MVSTMASDEEHTKAHKLAAKTLFDWRTALRWLRRQKVNRGTAATLERAAKDLGITRPAPQKEAAS